MSSVYKNISLFTGLIGVSLFCASAMGQYAPAPDSSQAPPPTQYDQPGAPPVPVQPPAVAPPPTTLSNAILEWVPPALTQLGTVAEFKTGFTLDRTMLEAAMSLSSGMDPETRQAARKIEGISVHILRFGPNGIPNEEAVNAVREAYHLRGWRHLVATEKKHPGEYENGATDLWLVMDGMTVRGTVALLETPRSVTLVTMAGNLNPVDMLHLRGHFGIPKFAGDDFHDAHEPHAQR